MYLVEQRFELVMPMDGNDALKKIELCGRTCYKSESSITDDSARKFVKMIIDRGHESVLEHVSVTVRIICDRGVSHELVRHRLCAFSQESTRYCDYSKEKHGSEIAFIMPPDMSPAEEKIWRRSVTRAEKDYMEMTKAGSKPQIARSLLPNALKTEIVTTANVRQWRHMFNLRTHKAAHPQMREVMVPLLAFMQRAFPVLFDDIEVVD